jgi:hypothetical protein
VGGQTPSLHPGGVKQSDNATPGAEIESAAAPTSATQGSQMPLPLRPKSNATSPWPVPSTSEAGPSRSQGSSSTAGKPTSRGVTGEINVPQEVTDTALPDERTGDSTSVPIRIALSDGRTLTADEYEAINERRAGKKRASSPALVTPTSRPQRGRAVGGKYTLQHQSMRSESLAEMFRSDTIQVRPGVKRAAGTMHAAAKSFLDRAEKTPPEVSNLERQRTGQ